ncbi:hypothetical protein ACF0H5_019631 [Mactra antiquata]
MDVKRAQTETLGDTIKDVTLSAQDKNEGSVQTFTNGATSSSASCDSKGDSAMDVRSNADQINSEISETNNDDPDSGCNESDTQSYSAKRRNSKLDRSTSQEHSIQTDIIQPSDGHTVSNQQTVSLDDNSTSAETEFSDDAWRLSIEDFTSKRQGSKRKNRKLSKEMRSYYKKQDENIDVYAEIRGKTSFYKSQDTLIDQYEEVRMEIDDAMENAEYQKQLRKKASLYAKITFLTNLILLGIKVVAVVLSGSISLISSLVDSSVDLLSGLVIWVTSRAVKKTDRYVYPQGRTKLEPMAIVILSVIMSVASLQIIKEALTKIVGLANDTQSPPKMDWITIGISSATVIVKLVLFLLCRRIPHPTVQALAMDHRNDVLSNSVAIVFGYIGSQEMQQRVNVGGLVYLDPIGAILISIYIIGNWIITGWDQIKQLVGHTASADFISKITWICVDHHRKVEKVDTVRAFHFGMNYLVEVDIVLPPDMTLREAHDIAEPLQQKLERLPDVERAFVHVDYEFTHDPKSEHKVV